MAELGKQFSFVVGEVSPEFFGREDLAKYPLGAAEVENFIVDYRGGLFNRPGFEYCFNLPRAVYRPVPFRSFGDDYILLFTHNRFYVQRNGGLVLTGDFWIGNPTAGHVYNLTGHMFSVGDLAYVSTTHSFYGEVTDVSGANVTIIPLDGRPAPSGSVAVFKVYHKTTTYPASVLYELSFEQNKNTLVITHINYTPQILTYVADTNWTFGGFERDLPAAPTGLASTYATDAGSAASVIFQVTAVVDGVEGVPSARHVIDSALLNYTMAEGWVRLTWAPVPGATEYYVYRSLVFPISPVDTGADLGYIGKTAGTQFTDMNIVPDFTKNPLRKRNYFSGGNNPAIFRRFQQRSYYAGLKNNPVDVVGSSLVGNDLFIENDPIIATDSFQYTLDTQVFRPIKHMLPLRYGLLLFTDNSIEQLTGASQSSAISPTNIRTETQGYVSVADLSPIAVNLDVLFFTQQYNALNVLLYTEYTNSFKTQDLAVLSAHMFSENNPVVDWCWVAEPHKLLVLVLADGTGVFVTYERTQEVFAFSRYRTKGKLKRVYVSREGTGEVVYFIIERYLQGKWRTHIERMAPRRDKVFSDFFFVDAGASAAPFTPDFSPTIWPNPVTIGGEEVMHWEVRWGANSPAFAVGDLMAAGGAVFRKVATVSSSRDLVEPVTSVPYDPNYQPFLGPFPQGEFRLYSPTDRLTGLWHLEGETVSVTVDGDAYTGLTVTGGEVVLPVEGACISVGLPYVAKAKSLPVRLDGYLLDGKLMTFRGIVTRTFRNRALKVGPTYDALEPVVNIEPAYWGVVSDNANQLLRRDFFGERGYNYEKFICFVVDQPLPCGVLGMAFELDVGG